ncbi:MAG: ComF family protein, partial [Betaproteobacteria bacterium]|nr:ComF family protein [Betaproteobacteria bacterium]
MPRLPAAHCPTCALPLPLAAPSPALCGRCLREPPAFDAVFAGLIYTFPVDRMIQRLKFNAALALVPALAGTLLTAIERHEPPDLMVPMPLSPARLRVRGFNQAIEIARRLERAGVAP